MPPHVLVEGNVHVGYQFSSSANGYACISFKATSLMSLVPSPLGFSLPIPHNFLMLLVIYLPL